MSAYSLAYDFRTHYPEPPPISTPDASIFLFYSVSDVHTLRRKYYKVLAGHSAPPFCTTSRYFIVIRIAVERTDDMKVDYAPESTNAFTCVPFTVHGM